MILRILNYIGYITILPLFLFWKQANKNPLLFLLIIILIGWFYWFQYRPAQIRENCATQTIERIKEKDMNTLSLAKKAYDTLYSSCLNSHGLTK